LTGTLLTVLHAIDDDIEGNGRVTYHLLSADDVIDAMFAINESTGELILNAGGLLDRETTPLYRLTVEARDNGFPVRSAVAVVTINVLDVNDNPPQVRASDKTIIHRADFINKLPLVKQSISNGFKQVMQHHTSFERRDC
jgi:Cadherin domain